MIQDSLSSDTKHGSLIWNKCPSMSLRNYQTNECLQVTGPSSKLYQDCRHQVCTSTLMNFSVHQHPTATKTASLPKYTQQELIHEAKEFLTIYHDDKKTSDGEYQARLCEAEIEIKKNGTIHYSFAELEYGCQLAWRNAARCINRVYWSRLAVIDKRHIKSNEEMFQAICDHIRTAYNNRNLQASVLVLPEKARMWSTQYLRFACYEQQDGSFLGDPMNRDLTQIAMKLGWKKPVEDRTQWDLLPIIVQCQPESTASWFELPDDCRPIVHLSHPDPKYDNPIKSLGLRWVAQPFVADKAIEIGGIIYQSVPFSGWFMGTEIGRDLCDIQRYNIVPKIARLLDLDVTLAGSSQLNIDRIYVEINCAVLHSFQQARITIVDHHNAAAGFMKFMKQEIATRGNTTADWTWLVPPLSSGMSVLFHQEMLNYVVKPCVHDQTNPWVNYRHFQEENKGNGIHGKSGVNWRSILALCKFIGFLKRISNKHTVVNVLYASTTGTAESYAKQMVSRLLKQGYLAKLLELDQFSFQDINNSKTLVLIITATFGQGNSPSNGNKTEYWIQSQIADMKSTSAVISNFDNRCNNELSQDNSNVKDLLKHYFYGVCAIGSRAYENFCQFGKSLDKALEALGANRLTSLATCDGLDNQYTSYCAWETEAILALERFFPCKTENADVSNDSKYSETKIVDGISLGRSSIDSNYIHLSFSEENEETVPLKHVGPYTKDRPCIATIVRNVELVEKSIASNYEDEHSVRMIEFETDGLFYYPGDHVFVFPENPRSDVNAIIKRCGMNVDDPTLDKPCSLAVISNHVYLTMRDLLTKFVDLITPPRPDVLKKLSTYAYNERQRKMVLELSDDQASYACWLVNFSTLKETLDEFESINIPLHELIQILPRLQPRPYSISSSSQCDENRLQITVSVVSFETSTKIKRKGLCSNFLRGTAHKTLSKNELLHSTPFKSANQVRLYINSNPHFRLPGQKMLTPGVRDENNIQLTLRSKLLMFAVGSGIAPFRSFWQELQVLQKERDLVKSDRILFIGCRTSKDLLYVEELKTLHNPTDKSKSLLSEVIPVYSRAQPGEKRYIQDKMLEYDRIIYSMIIDENAFIYMCGSIRACEGIEQALVSILESCHPTNLTNIEANVWIRKLKVAGRIQQEMFG